METVWVRSKWIVLWRLGLEGKPVYVGPPVDMWLSKVLGVLIHPGEK